MALPGVTLSAGMGGSAVTDGDGFYQITVNENWSGTVTPAKGAYRFTPEAWNYELVNADLTGRNYAAVLTCTISGISGKRARPWPE